MLPGPPQPPQVADVASDSLTLHWSPPAMAQALGVCGYRVFAQTGGTSGFVTHVRDTGRADCASGCRVNALQPGIWYEFRVAALTAKGVGAQSGSSRPVQTAARGSGERHGHQSSGSFGHAGRESRRHMAREYKKLKHRLKEWELEFESVHGRPPTAEDRSLVRPMAEMHRRAQAGHLADIFGRLAMRPAKGRLAT